MARLFFISKRRPQQRCLLERPYGRFHHIPVELAKLGHEVHVLLIGHTGDTPCKIQAKGVIWHVLDLRASPLTLLGDCIKIAKSCNPDWIYGVSDAWVGCLAKHIAGKIGSKLAIDAYDDFESYMPWNFPLHWLWRRAIRGADVCTAAGPQLSKLMDESRTGKSRTEIIPMAADPEFIPMIKSECRAALNLPETAQIIGYAGSWASNRGTDMLLNVFRILRKFQPNIILALTGKPPEHMRRETGVVVLGYLQDFEMPIFINALDVSTVITANTRFGRGSYPVKLCEAMACNIPLVATATDAVKWMLSDAAIHLSPVGDARAFAEAVLKQLHTPKLLYPTPNTWKSVTSKLNEILTHKPIGKSSSAL